MTKRRLVLISALVSGAAVIIVWFVARSSNEGPGQLYGNVDIREVDLGFRVGGRIMTVVVDEGDRVDQGEALATLDPEPLREEVAAAEADVAQARAELSRLEAGARPQEVEQAAAAVSERRATLENARKTLARRQMLAESGAVSTQDLDAARTAVSEAEARLASAEETLALAEAGFRDEEVSAGRAALMRVEAQLATARRRLRDATLEAPASGVVLSRVREPGAIVSEGATVFTLSLENPVWVRAYVPEPQLGEVWPGRSVSVRTDAGEAYRGQIGFVSPTAEFTPKNVQTEELRTSLVYRLRVVVHAPDNSLRQGMPVTVSLRDDDNRSAARDD